MRSRHGFVGVLCLGAILSVARRREGQIERAQTKRDKQIARQLRGAGVDPHRRAGTGDPLTEQVIMFEGTHRGPYHLANLLGTPIGSGGPIGGPPSGYRERCALHGLDGDRLAVLLVAPSGSDASALALDANGSELARLDKPSRDSDRGPCGEPLRQRLARRIQRLGAGPRRVVAYTGEIGTLAPPRRTGRAAFRRVIQERSGAPVAVITQRVTTPVGRCYVVELDERIELRLRSVGLLVPLLWDFETVVVDGGG
jgi:hypothetical protein